MPYYPLITNVKLFEKNMFIPVSNYDDKRYPFNECTKLFFIANAMIEMEQRMVFFTVWAHTRSCKHHTTTFTRSAGRASVVRMHDAAMLPIDVPRDLCLWSTRNTRAN
jgi:hypothetical protein